MKIKNLQKATTLTFVFLLIGMATLSMNITSVIATTTTLGVEPTVFEEWSSGNAEAECGYLKDEGYLGAVCNYSLKIDEWGDSIPNDGTYALMVDIDEDGTLDHIADIVISNDDGETFDWALVDVDPTDNIVYYMCAVIVKAGTGANVFFYHTMQITSDTGLYAYEDREISHVTFCFRQEIAEEEIEYCYETAFGKGLSANCFSDYDFERWGWTNGPLSEGTYTFDMWAGAAHCDTEKGILVGTVEVVYSSGTVTVDFTWNSGIILEESHVYAGSDPNPSFKGKPTVAPGQYSIGTGLSSDIYIIVHAVVGIPITT